MEPRTNVRSALVLLGLPVLLLAPGCGGSPPARTERYVGAPRFAPRDANRVEVLEAEPERQYDRLGEVFVDPSGDPGRERLAEAIREGAAGMGADAAIVVRDPTSTFQPVRLPGRAPAPPPGRRYALTAVAIRYR